MTVILKEGAHIGHGAIIHGAVIGRNTLIGMNSVILDNAEIGEGSIIGALSLVRSGEKIPPRSLVAGNPAKIIKEVSEDMLQWKTAGTALYQALPADMRTGWEPCDPLPEPPPDRSGPAQRSDGDSASGGGEADTGLYKPWKANEIGND